MSAEGQGPTPLGGTARSIVDAARSAERLPSARKAELRNRVMAAVAAGAGASLAASAAKAASLDAATAGTSAAGSTSAAGAAASAAVKAAGLSLFAKIGLSVAVVTIGAGGLLYSRATSVSPGPPPRATASVFADFEEDPAPPSAAANTAAGSEAAPPSAGAAGDTGAKAAPEAEGRDSAASAAPTAAPSPRSDFLDGPSAGSTSAKAPAAGPAAPSGSATGDPLEDEAKLLAAAHTALSGGDAARALILLDQHAAKFPRGTLAPERRAARAMALCKLGRTAEGRREAEMLYGKDSKSPVAAKIERACGGN
jgi:hypothetical protein